MSVTFEPGLLRAYFVAGSQDVPGKDLRVVLAEMLQAGITAYQFRDKGASTLTPAERLALGRDLRDQCRAASVPFIVDDDVDMALALDADGVHVGQSDERIQQVLAATKDRQMFVGLSCSTSAEVAAANQLTGLAYIGSGPIYPTVSKDDADPVIGTAGLQALVAQANVPIVAIGGVTQESLPAIAQTGAAGVAVITLLTRNPQPERAVQGMLAAF
ncbi:thiamine phosphate synthase [Lactobacillus sp. PFC-70]|uniref:thiamine phosphate synthase n=1 Tax=Levilactobacillus namurensis TaxID=380393 RepID=UPI000D30418E|nr:thiamine phosphate synthase [Levilactobacillus namurensis]MCW3779282.1 thiamine phosphate synthase [Levilactobacillus namurensis]MDT7019485.1 thiamine phosphate synthase [Levilactobacillus namurensis]PTM21269.1 thiamine phosphate synthase [Lactobacillus sp. PFC-70]WNN65923.1 thiamine phosphate synthase [Levilactobacillus namurensis]